MNKQTEKREEAQLWAAFKRGSETAYAHIYKIYFFRLYNYGKKFTADAALVEDCIQQLFVELWQHKHNLGNTASVKNYLYKSFRRKILRKIHQPRRIMFMQHAAENYPFNISLSHENDIIRKEVEENQKHLLEEGLKMLSEKQKEAIFLKFYDRLSYDEISRIMELDTKAVYDLIYKGTRKLKKYLQHKKPLLLSFVWAVLALLFLL